MRTRVDYRSAERITEEIRRRMYTHLPEFVRKFAKHVSIEQESELDLADIPL